MKIGLVLAGGGGKGAYQIGVWKYLREIGLSEKISVISGTSVGGLNGVLLSLCNFNKAEEIWTDEIKDCILDSKSKTQKNNALFSREGLRKIIKKNIDLKEIKKLKRKLYVTCFGTGMDDLGSEYYCLNNKSPKDIKQLLCATSAIPVVFQREEIQGKKLIDGGVKENVPLSPLHQVENCTHAIIVNLDDKYTDYKGFPITTVDIHPSANLGGLISGTLNFSPERIKKMIDVGYNDCRTIYKTQLDAILGDNMIDSELSKEMDRINNMAEKTILLETLKYLVNAPHEVGRLQCNKNVFSEKTQGGKVFWKDIAEYNGWRVQEHSFLHCVRFLDPLDHCKSWSTNKDKMIGVCKQFLVQNLKK